jgi:chromosome segregation ATPase
VLAHINEIKAKVEQEEQRKEQHRETIAAVLAENQQLREEVHLMQQQNTMLRKADETTQKHVKKLLDAVGPAKEVSSSKPVVSCSHYEKLEARSACRLVMCCSFQIRVTAS